MKKLISIALLTCVAATANASIVMKSTDLHSADDGLLTLDENTGLEWLDVSQTVGYSVNEIIAGQGGWIDAGFRYATLSELTAMFVDGGLWSVDGTVPARPWYLGSYDSAGPALTAMLGPTSASAEAAEVRGFTAPFIESSTCGNPWECEEPRSLTYSVHLIARDMGPGKVTAATFYSEGPLSTGYHSSGSPTGSWLVRETPAYAAPEPGMLFLLAAGGFAFALTRRRLVEPSHSSASAQA